MFFNLGSDSKKKRPTWKLKAPLRALRLRRVRTRAKVGQLNHHIRHQAKKIIVSRFVILLHLKHGRSVCFDRLKSPLRINI